MPDVNAAHDGLAPGGCPTRPRRAGAETGLAKEARGRPEDDVAPEPPHPGDREDELVAGARHPHVAEAPLLRERLRGRVAVVGHQPLLGAHDDHRVELEPLRRMERQAEHLRRRPRRRVLFGEHHGVQELGETPAGLGFPPPRQGQQRGDVLGPAVSLVVRGPGPRVRAMTLDLRGDGLEQCRDPWRTRPPGLESIQELGQPAPVACRLPECGAHAGDPDPSSERGERPRPHAAAMPAQHPLPRGPVERVDEHATHGQQIADCGALGQWTLGEHPDGQPARLAGPGDGGEARRHPRQDRDRRRARQEPLRAVGGQAFGLGAVVTPGQDLGSGPPGRTAARGLGRRARLCPMSRAAVATISGVDR